MFGIVYGLENNFDHKIYISQTHRTLEERFSEHKYANSLIGSAIRKYGEENFVKVVLEECENQEQLDACEIKWIALLNSMSPNGYNLTAGGNGGCLGYKLSAETRAKISIAKKGIKISEEHRQKLIASVKGKSLSAEHKRKLSVAHKGKKISAEQRQKISESNKGNPAWNKGKKMPPEICAKLSAAKKGKPSPKKGIPLPPEVKAKISAARKGKPAWNKGKKLLKAAY